MKKILIVLFHPAALAIIFTIIIILFLPSVFNKYQVKIIERNRMHKADVNSFYDLNSDGFSEEIKYHGPPLNYPTFIVKSKGKVIDQWNFKGIYPNSDFFIYCDYDNDSTTEIFVLTIKDDSIFLFGINPYKDAETYFIKLFIDKCSKYDGRYDCEVLYCDSPDIDKNGFKELVVGIQTGRSKQPRNLYLVDIFNNTVTKSPESGTAIQNPLRYDLNGDGYNEYMGRSPAHGNIHGDSIDYPDQFAWLMVLDRNLKFLFKPQKFGQYKTTLDVKPFSPFNTKYLVVSQIHQGNEDVKNKLMLFNVKGQMIKERVLEDYKIDENLILISRDKLKRNDLYLFLNNKEIMEIDSALNIVNTISLPDVQNLKPFRIDIDMDGKDEFIFIAKDKQGLIITRNDFSSPVKLELIENIDEPSHYSLIKHGDEKLNLYFQLGGQSFIVEYSKNPLYPVKYLTWILIYGIVFTLLYILQKIQHIRAERRFETEQKIASLQLRAIKGQTDPHFTLNLIDSIGNLFYKKDSEKAAYVFGKYAKLLRTTILSAENISVSLEDEIEYVKNYLDLEKFRYDEKFNYNIEISKNVNTNVEIPKMLIHTFVENAIKHGLKHKEKWGTIDITAKEQPKIIEVSIRDNGVGRKQAKEYSKLSTGKGLQILNNMLELYYNLKKTKITYKIIDLNTANGKPDGTLVIINIPIKARK